MSKLPVERERQIEQRARDALEQELQHMDAETLSRLRQARERALESAGSRVGFRYKTGIPFALAAVLLVVVGLQVLPRWSPTEGEPLLAVEGDVFDTFELLVSTDDVTFYEQLDFLLWLNEEEHAS